MMQKANGLLAPLGGSRSPADLPLAVAGGLRIPKLLLLYRSLTVAALIGAARVRVCEIIRRSRGTPIGAATMRERWPTSALSNRSVAGHSPTVAAPIGTTGTTAVAHTKSRFFHSPVSKRLRHF